MSGICHTHRFNERAVNVITFVRSERAVLIGWQLEILDVDKVPNRFVNSVRIARRWGKRINRQHMDALPKCLGNFLDELSDRGPAIFIAGRNDLDESHVPAQLMTNDDALGL